MVRMSKALAIRFDDDTNKVNLLSQLRLDRIAIELKQLHDAIQADIISSSSPVLFCHNDLLCGNLLLEPSVS
jgi:thiamine kinase-like enzyme